MPDAKPQDVQFGTQPAKNPDVQFGKHPATDTVNSDPTLVGVVPVYAGGDPVPESALPADDADDADADVAAE